MFSLNSTLEKDTVLVGDLPVCRVLLMDDSRFPWLILVPRREALRELFELNEKDYAAVMGEVRVVAEKLAGFTKAHKMNVAALGNMIPQLHIHIIARLKNDAAWPRPVWGVNLPAAYDDVQKSALTADMARLLNITKM